MKDLPHFILKYCSKTPYQRPHSLSFHRSFNGSNTDKIQLNALHNLNSSE